MRRVRALLIVLAVLIGLFVIADRVSLRMAQNEVRDQVLRHAAWDGGRTEVRIGGFPFLTQVARGDYREIEVRAEGVTIDDVPDVTLAATLHGVHLSISDLRSRDVSSLPVDRIDGYAEVAYAAVADRIAEAGRNVGIAEVGLRGTRGTLQLAVQLEVMGQQISGVATGALAVSDGALHLSATGLEVDGSAPQWLSDAALAALNAVLTQVSVMPTLPYGLRLTSVSLTDDGIRAEASAVDVTL